MRPDPEQAGNPLLEALEEIAARRTRCHRRPDDHLEITFALAVAERTRLGIRSAEFIRIFTRHLKPMMATGRHMHNNAPLCYSGVTAA
jgi:hypothetical protein